MIGKPGAGLRRKSMPVRRKNEGSTAVAVEEPGLIENTDKEVVDHHVKQLVDSASLPEAPRVITEAPPAPIEAPPVIDEAHLKELMSRMLHARERAQQARERVREISSEVGG